MRDQIKRNLAVIFGGRSPEHEVSLQSAAAVIEHLDRELFRVICIYISKEGRWYRYYGEAERIADGSLAGLVSDAEMTAADAVPAAESAPFCRPAWISPSRGEGLVELTGAGPAVTRIDLAFPVLHGQNGEDGTVQGLLELAGIPVAGCGTMSSALCMDKDRAHRLVKMAGVDVPKSVTVARSSVRRASRCAVGAGPAAAADISEAALGGLKYPVFVKPVRAGSSFGITKVSDPAALPDALEEAFRYDDLAVIEEEVPGFEVGCAVMGTDPDDLFCGRVDEIELADGFFDFREKYTLETSKIHCPARIDELTEKRVQACAKVIYRALGCSGLARVDMFLTPAGRIVFNEVNTIPGFTTHSRYPNMMKAAGLDFPEMLRRLMGQYV